MLFIDTKSSLELILIFKKKRIRRNKRRNAAVPDGGSGIKEVYSHTQHYQTMHIVFVMKVIIRFLSFNKTLRF